MWALLLLLVQGFALSESFRDPTPRSRHPGAKIVGGEQADISEFPWQLSLQRGIFGIIWSHSCGAVLIGERTALTAAHCVDGAALSNLRVIVGASKSDGSQGDKIYIDKVTMHPGYDGSAAGYPNDIAVLTLSSPAEVGSDNINTIELAPEDNLLEGERCTITGWGKTSGSASSSSLTLQKVKMGVQSNPVCRGFWAAVSGAEINDGHICVYEGEGVSACSGDSGGPLTCDIDGQPYVAGVTSWGISNCDGTYPSVYTRVSYFWDFIKDNS